VISLDEAASPHDRLEVRVLGPLRVRRPDGLLVEPSAWRTGQTADLLRLLALHVDEPVPVDVLLDALWPSVDEQRGRASLRTAASRIRKAAGVDCVGRRLGGLVLHDAWVDAHAFEALARDAHRHALTGASAKVVTATREAEPLYLAEGSWHTGGADWALQEVAALSATYRQLMADAAQAAVTLMWWNDALDFAGRWLQLEPCSERAWRVRMLAYRGLGEGSRALQSYEQCRLTLADQIGTAPSPETQALFRELLDERPVELPTPPFRGRSQECRWLGELAAERGPGGAPQVVCLVGPAEAGKTRLVQELAASVGLPLLPAAALDADDPHPGTARPETAGIVLVDDAHLLPTSRLAGLAGLVPDLPAQVALVVVAGRPGQPDGGAPDWSQVVGEHVPVQQLRLPPLGEDEVSDLCGALLQGPVCEEFGQVVLDGTGGLPGRVIELVRTWASSGRVAATSEGLVVVQGHRSNELRAEIRHLLSAAVDHLTAGELEVLHLIAVHGAPVAPDDLLPLCLPPEQTPDANARAVLHKTLDSLTDRTLVVATDDGFTVRDALLRDALLAWLRPSALRALHRRVAETAHISAADRVEHWRGAGEPLLARAAALEAAGDALSEGRYDRARALLVRLSAQLDTPEADPEGRVDVLQRLGDVCLALGRVQEGNMAYADAVGIARAHGLPELVRLEAKLGDSAEVQVRVQRTPLALAGEVPARPRPVAVPLLDPGTAPDPDVESRLTAAMRGADSAEDAERGAELRTQLTATVCVPRRQFRAAHRWTTEALELSADPSRRARALLAGWLPGAVLGNGAGAQALLQQAVQLAGSAGDDEAHGQALALQCLVSHDLGAPDHAVLMAQAAAAGVFSRDSEHQWVLLRMLAERYELADAEDVDLASTTVPPVIEQLGNLALAELDLARGRSGDARERLLQVIDSADDTGTTLLVPEAAARLVGLEAADDPASARERFELFEWAAGGDRLLPRENVLRHLGRAALRAADGRPDDAAAAGAAAADAAEQAGLVLLGAEAHRQRAQHLASAGRRSESRLAAASAARAYERAGVTGQRPATGGVPRQERPAAPHPIVRPPPAASGIFLVKGTPGALR